MFDSVITLFKSLLLSVFKESWLVTLLLSALPIVEARLGVPMSLSFGYDGLTAFALAFIGSTLPAPVILALLSPVMIWLKGNSRLSRVMSGRLVKLENKSAELKGKSVAVRFWGVLAFVALPLPLTGVWSGCIVASLSGMKWAEALLAVASGNLVASGIVTILCCLFPESVINCIIAAVGALALVTLAFTLIKALFPLKKRS